MIYTCVAVDDEPSSLEYISNLFSEITSFQLLFTTESPIEAKTYIENNSVDLLITDIEMNELDGISLNYAVEHLCHTIFITGHTDLAIEAMGKNALEVMNKPFPPNEFYQALDKAKIIIDFQKQKKANALVLAKYALLSNTEKNILLEIGGKKGNKQISDDNHIAISTLEAHKANIKLKLCLKSSQDLLIFAHELLKII